MQKEVAGVEVRGQGEHAQIQLASQEQLQGAIRRGLPGLVAVKDQTTRSASRAERPEMILAQSRPQRADDVAEPDLMGRDHVGVTLDHGHPARLAARRPRQVRRVEDRSACETARSRGC